MKKLKLLTIFLLLLPACVILFGVGCDEEDEYSDFVEGYVVGSFIGDEINTEGEATGNKTERGYCILLEASKNKQMDFYTYNFPNTMFTFPDEILSASYNGYNCGPVFFPDSLKYDYKIKFRYQIVNNPYKVLFAIGPCSAWALAFPWENFDQVNVNETTKN
jgi:hypothetical protein